ncbi:MAG: hypothetical protein HS128_15190 [Ideonella sp.]|nr:hypothetical protein [Ideonella sp.]MCC7457423.1 hypothetical protein [Nitrospira sp.]
MDFDSSTLWRISEFERIRLDTGHSGYNKLSGPTVLPTTLVSELARLEYSREGSDAMEVLAACMRHREAALVYVLHRGLVWPITVFPRERLYHSPRDFTREVKEGGMRELHVHSVEPPGVRAPGHFMSERVAEERHYRPLDPLLWALGLHGPRGTLIDEISGSAAYRISPDFHLGSLAVSGALGPVIQRLRRETASLRAISRWPGMTVDRAVRLLNGLYLLSGLMVLRMHPAARKEPSTQSSGWLGWIKKSR